jgi:hypothetical protein
MQQEGVDFGDAFILFAWMESVRLLLALAAQEGRRVHHMDVKSSFLNGDLKEEVYVHQPPGFVIPGKEARSFACARPSTACGWHRGVWNAKLDGTLRSMGFVQSPHEAAVYRRGKGGNALLVVSIETLTLIERMTLGVGVIFWFTSHTMPCQLEGLGIHIYT